MLLDAPIEIINCEQNSDEWYAARSGIITASDFSSVLAKGKTAGSISEMRKKLLASKTGEIISGRANPSWGGNAHTERGHEMEPEVRARYDMASDEDCYQVGFVRRGRIGCSPDLMVGERGMLEVKTALPHIQIERILKGDLPSEYKAQVQGQLLVTDRDWVDFRSFWPGLPQLKVRVYRDLPYLSNLATELSRFIEELDQLVERIRSMQ